MGQFEWMSRDKVIEVMGTKVAVVDFVSQYLGYRYDRYWWNLAHVAAWFGGFLIVGLIGNKMFWWKSR